MPDEKTPNASDAYPDVAPIAPEDLAIQPANGTDEGEDEALAALHAMQAKRKRRKRGRIIKTVIIVGVVAVAAVLFLLRDTLFPAPTPEIEPNVITVERTDFSTTVQGSGSLQAGETVVVTPEVAGIIDEVRVTEGQYVEKGDIVVVLRNTDLDKLLEEAADQVNSAANSVYNAQVAVGDIEQAYSDAVDEYNDIVDLRAQQESEAKQAGDEAYKEAYDKAVSEIPEDASDKERARLLEEARVTAEMAYQAAYDSVPITPLVEFDDASYIAQISAAQEGVVSAQGALNSAQKSYDQAAEQADKRYVKAPAAGVVLALNAVTGAAVGGAEGGTSASSGALMQISDLTTMKVSIEVNEIDILSVKEGQRARITFSALPELELEGKVVHVATVASGSGGGEGYGGGGGVATFKVDLEIAKPDERLKPGMTATVRILTMDEQNVLVIPLSALQEYGDEAFVEAVIDPETLKTEMREVKVGARSSSDVVIEEGLAEGDLILGSSGMMLGAGESGDGDYGDEGVAVSATINVEG